MDKEILDRLLNGTLTELLDEMFETDEVKASVMHTLDMKDMDEPGVLFGYASIKPNLLTTPHNLGLVTGGMGTLTTAMARSAQGFGAKIRLGAEVKRILIQNGQAQGVECPGTTPHMQYSPTTGKVVSEKGRDLAIAVAPISL